MVTSTGRRCASHSSPDCVESGDFRGSRASSHRCIGTWKRPESSVLASLLPDAAHQGEEARADRPVRSRGRRYRLGRGSDRAADGAHQPPHRAPSHAWQGPPLAPRAADDGRQAAAAAQVPGELRPRPVSQGRLGPRPAALISAGEKAPDFSLPNHKGEQVSLSDFRGRRVLLAFYPSDFSPVCSDQLSIYQEVKPSLDEAGLEVLGVSVDHSWAHRAFRKQLNLDFTLLADFHPKGRVADTYGAYLADYGTTNRSLVLIDEEGVVRWVHESPPLEIPGANLIF